MKVHFPQPDDVQEPLSACEKCKPMRSELEFALGDESGLENLIGQIIADVSKRGGIFHLWGHSWEIDSMGLWERLGKVFEYMGNSPNSTT